MEELNEIANYEEELKKKPPSEETIRGWGRSEKLKCGVTMVKELLSLQANDKQEEEEMEESLREIER